jgi:drug/metabolite transporter (DMT)-like permease
LLTGAIFGLLTAVIWGVGDFLSRKPSEQIGSLLTSIYVQPFGLALLLVFLAVSQPANVVGILTANYPYLLLNVLAGVLGFTGLCLLYKGYFSGVMSVVAPIAGSYPVISVTLSVVFLGVVLTPIRSLAIVGVIAGIVLTGVRISDFRRPVQTNDNEQGKVTMVLTRNRLVKGVDYSIATCICAGFALFGLGVASTYLGPILSVVILKCAEMLTATALIITVVKKIVKPTRTTLVWLAIIGICDAMGFVSYNYGIQSTSDLPIVVTLSSLLGVVTVILARTFYNERLGKLQVFGVFVIFGSVATILYF